MEENNEIHRSHIGPMVNYTAKLGIVKIRLIRIAGSDQISHLISHCYDREAGYCLS